MRGHWQFVGQLRYPAVGEVDDHRGSIYAATSPMEFFVRNVRRLAKVHHGAVHLALHDGDEVVPAGVVGQFFERLELGADLALSH